MYHWIEQYSHLIEQQIQQQRRGSLPAAETLCVDQIIVDHLHSPIPDVVHPLHPEHLILAFDPTFRKHCKCVISSEMTKDKELTDPTKISQLFIYEYVKVLSERCHKAVEASKTKYLYVELFPLVPAKLD